MQFNICFIPAQLFRMKTIQQKLFYFAFQIANIYLFCFSIFRVFNHILLQFAIALSIPANKRLPINEVDAYILNEIGILNGRRTEKEHENVSKLFEHPPIIVFCIKYKFNPKLY